MDDADSCVSLITEHKFAEEIVHAVKDLQSQQKRQVAGVEIFRWVGTRWLPHAVFCSKVILCTSTVNGWVHSTNTWKLGVIRFKQLRWNLLVRLVCKVVVSVPHPSEECTSGPLSRHSRVLWNEFPAQFALLIFIYKLPSFHAVSLSFSFLHTLLNGSKFSFFSSNPLPKTKR